MAMTSSPQQQTQRNRLWKHKNNTTLLSVVCCGILVCTLLIYDYRFTASILPVLKNEPPLRAQNATDRTNFNSTATATAVTTRNHKSNLTTAAELDPYSLQKGIVSFFRDSDSDATADSAGNSRLWKLLEEYPKSIMQQPAKESSNTQTKNAHHIPLRHHPLFYYQHDKLSSELICGVGPGRGMEQDGGYKLLVEKLRIVQEESTRPTSTTKKVKTANRPRLLCLVYTYSPMRYLVRSQALLWGNHCDGFLAFSNETIPELGIYDLPIDKVAQPNYPPQESYNNMWQKSRAIWKVVHDEFRQEFDYFYLSGDDVYLMVTNLRSYLAELETLETKIPRHFGSWLPNKSVIAGGPGYVLNRAALEMYVGGTHVHREGRTHVHLEGGTHDPTTGNNNTSNTTSNSSVWSTCMAFVRRPYEDRFLSWCLSQDLNIWGNATDTRDLLTGAQRFHDAEPSTLYSFRASESNRASYFARMAKSWEDQPLPKQEFVTTNGASMKEQEQPKVVGPKHELESAAKHSISLHRIHTPTYMARIHAILFPETCPSDSPLGIGLRKHHLPEVAI